MPSAPAEDGGDSEPSDEDAAALSAESRDTADEDTPGPAARAPEHTSALDATRPASPQEPAVPGDGVDLLGLHAEAGPAPPAQASAAPPSNADLLGSLLGTPEAAPEASPGDLLGGEDPLLFTSPAPPPGTRSTPRDGPGPAPAGACSGDRGDRHVGLPAGLPASQRLLGGARERPLAVAPPPLVPRGRGRACPHGGVWALCAQRWLRRHHRARQRLISSCSSGVATADPFDALLLTSDLDAPAQPQPDPFCEFLNADPAAPPAPFPSAHSAPPPACSTDFLQLGEWPAPRPWAHPAWLPVLPPREGVGWRPPEALCSVWGAWKAGYGGASVQPRASVSPASGGERGRTRSDE